MREITASELSKILREHKIWLYSGYEEREKADLSEANLGDADLNEDSLWDANLIAANYINVRGLTIEQLSSVETLCKAKLDPELMEQVKDKYPHLLKKPKSEE